MNYIKQLQEENKELKNTIKESQEIIHELYQYLHSSKFHQDNSVNIHDIFLRLEPARELLTL